jgi:hypothetical protein
MTSSGRQWRGRLRTAAAAAAAAALVAGCGSSSASTKGDHYWLVKVLGDYANVYQYPPGDRPGTNKAVELGRSAAAERAHVRAAAARLGIPLSHVTNETSS